MSKIFNWKSIVLSIFIIWLMIFIFSCVSLSKSNNYDERFERIYSQNIMEVWVDKTTGVQYLFNRNYSHPSYIVLVDKDGNPLLYNE